MTREKVELGSVICSKLSLRCGYGHFPPTQPEDIGDKRRHVFSQIDFYGGHTAAGQRGDSISSMHPHPLAWDLIERI